MLHNHSQNRTSLRAADGQCSCTVHPRYSVMHAGRSAITQQLSLTLNSKKVLLQVRTNHI